MILKHIFNKPVDRAIDGVIKADDEASLRHELEEYVLTNEVSKRLENFLSAYTNYVGANGAWISGFFGSGKSHLLKMLAILLENRRVEEVSALELFLPKCADNEILSADLKKAVAIPSKSILFNIDQKADVISKTQLDALLAVFVKVFDEMCGYYGKQAYIAQFERELDRDGLFEAFKKAFESHAGNTWEWGRSRPTRVAAQVDAAYNQITGQSHIDVLDKHRQDYRLSIEDFAENINSYITQQPKHFRLNFFVDEVGQYIADNVKLMTNLQTIAESLATRCNGRSWVIVTAQEDMSSVLGEMEKQQGNDFSKIQARFKNRMKLTSQDVAEVIQKRLLAKNAQGISALAQVYNQQSNNFKTLFDFADGSQAYRNFRDQEHFIYSYPFIPYQFALFQSAIQNLSKHNAFEGKHSSVGERSMLGVFQQVAMQISDHELGQLATFDLMFEGIRSALKSSIQQSILRAENHLDSAFALKILKTLFLIKYIKEFKPTLRNLCVLMLDRFNKDLPALKKQVEEALNILEQQTYIQRNGELYEFLTDEEKDVEEEIKSTEVETAEVAETLKNMIFENLIKTHKIRYAAQNTPNQGQDYPFTKKLDDRIYGRESELAIHVISPFHEHSENESVLINHSVYHADELLVIMPPSDRLMRDLLMLKRTEKYIRQNNSITQREAVKRILTDKGFQNREREAELQRLVNSLMSKAKLIVAGTTLDIGGEDPQGRIVKAFHELIVRVYPNLGMLRGVAYTEQNLGRYLSFTEDSLLSSDASSLTEAEQELLAFIQSNARQGLRTTLKSLIERFECKPYGWYYAAILCTLGHLHARGKLEIRSDSHLLEGKALEQALLNTHTQGNIVIDPQVEFTPAQVRALKTFFEDFFNEPPKSSEAKALAQETQQRFKEFVQNLSIEHVKVAQYPFLQALSSPIEQITQISKHSYAWYLTDLKREQERLLALKDDIIDPINKLMSGAQKAIYDDARAFIQQQEANFSYLEGTLVSQLKHSLNSPTCYRGTGMQTLKTDFDQARQALQTQVTQVRQRAIETLNTMQSRLQAMPEYQQLPDVRQQDLDKPFDELRAFVQSQSLIAVINDKLREFEESRFQRLLTKLDELAHPKPASAYPDVAPSKVSPETHYSVAEPAPAPIVDYVHYRQVPIAYQKAWLGNEQDVEEFIDAMRKALQAQVRQGKRIQI
jgi:hypothetical protein